MGDVEMSSPPEEGPHELELLLEEATAEKSRAKFDRLLAAETNPEDVRGMRAKEGAVLGIGKLLVEKKDVAGIKQLLVEVRPFFEVMAKSRTARIVRRLFDLVSASGCPVLDQVSLVEDFIKWAREQKRSFLRQRLQTRLGELRFQLERYQEALQGVNTLLREVRRLDDKQMLVDVHILESRLYYVLRNSSKAKAGLVAARTAAHAIYIAPLTQAEIDMQSGIISAEEKDFKVAFSYFFEAFEAYHGTGENRSDAETALKYMLMSKILEGSIQDMTQILQQKSVLEYRGLRTVDAMKDIAAAHKTRDLHKFNQVREEYKDVFTKDAVAEGHLDGLYNKLLEQHLLRVIEPYERVEVSHLAELIKLDASLVENKLSQMILDDKLNGILDQAHHCLIVYPEDIKDNLYPDSLETLENLHKVVDTLFDKCAGKFVKKDDEKKKDEKDKDKEKDGSDDAKDKDKGKDGGAK